jgi:hypothetical protein
MGIISSIFNIHFPISTISRMNTLKERQAPVYDQQEQFDPEMRSEYRAMKVFLVAFIALLGMMLCITIDFFLMDTPPALTPLPHDRPWTEQEVNTRWRELGYPRHVRPERIEPDLSEWK